MEYKLLIDGQWVNAGPLMEVKNKYNGEVIAALPTARKEDVDAAIAAAAPERVRLASAVEGASWPDDVRAWLAAFGWGLLRLGNDGAGGRISRRERLREGLAASG